jgi:hypothetical protein
MKTIVRIWRVFCDRRPAALRPLKKSDYERDLLRDPDKAKAAFEKAWAIRNFEIEMYWKRATYFWAFIASTFVGYFGLTSSSNYQRPDVFDHSEVYVVICVGFLLSLAWLLTNIGSKSWQRHWEVHVDLLEDQFTGPLYKTTYPRKTFFVSKINEIVSAVITTVWLMLGIKFLFDQSLIHFPGKPDWMIGAATVGTLLAVCAMIA